MSTFENVVDSVDGSKIYLNGASFYLRKNGNLDKWKSMIGNYTEEDFEIGVAIEGMSLELSDSERVVLFKPAPVRGEYFIVTNAYASSKEAAKKRLNEFRETTNLGEMEVPESVLGFYRELDPKDIETMKKHRRII